MSLYTLRTGATAHPEDSVLQLVTDLISNSGVISKDAGTTHFAVQAQGTSDMTIKVKAGRAYIVGSTGNAYPVISDADTSVAIGSNGSGSTRVDAIVLYIDKAASANSDATNVAKLIAVQGTTSAPTDGAIQTAIGAANPLLRLADISVGSGVTSITSGNITDQRVVVRQRQIGDSVSLKEQSSTPVAPPATLAKLYLKTDGKLYDLRSDGLERELLGSDRNFLKNGNFINNSTNGYGNTPDDWNSSNGNLVSGAFPEMTKQQVIDLLGVSDGDIEALWALNGNYTDLSSNGYTLSQNGGVTDSSDGLMAQCKDFERDSSQWAENAAANCNISGAQTWICFVKPESLTGSMVPMGLRNSGGGNEKNIVISSNGVASFFMTGLTTNAGVDSFPRLTAGKWYMLVGIFDPTNSKLKIWVNGVKTEVTASGSASAVTSNFALGRQGSNSNNYYDGLLQNAMVLSVALSDTQVKRLWSISSYKGLKVRRNTTNAYASQDLLESDVERLRGKTITIAAELYQEIASTAQISIFDGTTETLSAVDATTGQWLEKSVTITVPSTTNQLTVRIKHSTTNGNTWYRKVRLTIGGEILPYTHALDDWSRFPRLLRLNPATIITGYTYEEKRWFDYSPSYGPGGSMTFTGVTTPYAKFKVDGYEAMFAIRAMGTAGGSLSNNVTFTFPVLTISSPSLIVWPFSAIVDQGAAQTGFGTWDTTVGGVVRKYDANNFTAGALNMNCSGFYPID